jgi:hypothetical protein
MIEYLPLVLTGIGIIVSILYYASVLRNANKTREMQLVNSQTQLFMQIFDKLTAPEQRQTYMEILDGWNWNDYSDFMSKYGPDDSPEQWLRFVTLMSQFERMGLLVRENLVNPNMILHWVGSYPIRLWDKYENIIDEYRIRCEPPPVGGQWEWFEDMTYVLRKVREEDLKDFDDRLARRKKFRTAYGKEIPAYLDP